MGGGAGGRGGVGRGARACSAFGSELHSRIDRFWADSHSRPSGRPLGFGFGEQAGSFVGNRQINNDSRRSYPL